MRGISEPASVAITGIVAFFGGTVLVVVFLRITFATMPRLAHSLCCWCHVRHT
jgi:hypothetical protein